jgi:hypothetical protein
MTTTGGAGGRGVLLAEDWADDLGEAGHRVDLALRKAVRGRVTLEEVREAGVLATMPVS